MVKRVDVISPGTLTVWTVCDLSRTILKHLFGVDIITQRAIELFKTCERPYPVLHMSLTVSGLSVDESSTTHNITKFFTNSSEGTFDLSGSTATETKSAFFSAESKEIVKDPKIESKPKGIAALFFAQTNIPSANNEAKEGCTRCDECGNWIAEEDVVEHADFHFAKRLQDEDRRSETALQNTSAIKSKSSTTSKKRKSPSRNDESQKDPRLLFFQPRRS